MNRSLKVILYGVVVGLFFFLCIFTVDYAKNAYKEYNQKIDVSTCGEIGNYAITFMSNRQNGISLEESKKYLNNSNPPKIIEDILHDILDKSYKHPIVNNKIDVVLQFGMSYMNSCYTTLNAKNEEIQI